MNKIMKWSQITFLGNLTVFIIILTLIKIINVKSELLWAGYAVSMLFLLVSFFVFVFLKIIFNYKKIYQFIKMAYFQGLSVYRNKNFRIFISFTLSFLMVVLDKLIKLIFSNNSSDIYSSSHIYDTTNLDDHEYYYYVNSDNGDYDISSFKIGDHDNDYSHFSIGSKDQN
jgi:hypothetical protein